MTKKPRLNNLKVLATFGSLLLFVVVITYADALGNQESDIDYVLPAFLGDENNSESIHIDEVNVSISMDDEGNGVINYVVQPGDTLEKISQEYGIPVSSLKSINTIKGAIKPGQVLVVTDNEDGILYIVREKQNVKVFAEKYGLNLQDLMTLNYIQDESEILQQDQQLFINVTEERARNIPGFLDKAQPDLSEPVIKKPTTTKKNTTSTTTTKKNTGSSSTQQSASQVTPVASDSKTGIVSKWSYNKKINNGFAAGYCTWYVATQMPSIFAYDETGVKQSRPFGGNAKEWYKNAKAAGYSVGTTPRSGAIVVYGKLRSSAGHVGIVKSYDPATGKMLVEDMNYAGKYIVTQRWENASRSEIIGYIYP